jgi:hypothetical protein
MVQNRSAFEFGGLLPGVYDLRGANSGTAADKMGYLRVVVTNENIENLRLVMRPVIEVKGRIVQEDGKSLSNVRVQLRGISGGAGIQINPTAADGSFTVTRLTPDDYRLAVSGMEANQYVKSARLGSRDVENTPVRIEAAVSDPLEIVLGLTTGALDTVVLDRNRQPAAAAIVVLVPSPERRQRFELYRTATTDSAGRASITNIAPGAYKLFAWQDIEPNAWQNADALRAFEERGVAVTIAENGKASQGITVIE